MEVQIVDYNREYELDLTDYSQLGVTYENVTQKELFEKVLVCKLYGIEYALEPSSDQNSLPTLSYTNYTDISYNITYGNGAEDQGDVTKCIFGIINKFTATGKPSNIKSLNIEDTYMFLFAHKDIPGNDNGINTLRAHKVIVIPNSHIVDPQTIPADGYNACGLFAGEDANGVDNCILGFKKDDVQSNQWYFYLPSYSYCLEGRTQNIINLGENYSGKFKVNLPTIASI